LQVRFEEAAVDDEDGPTLEVVPAPVPEQWRPKTFDEQTVDLAPADKEALAQNRQGYAVFPMVGWGFWGMRTCELEPSTLILEQAGGSAKPAHGSAGTLAASFGQLLLTLASLPKC
jgi:hypothetical protein